MEVFEIRKDQVRLSLAAGELLLLSNALNEIVNGIDLPGFDTRLGSSRERAQKLLIELSALIDKMNRIPHG